jgi:hypothetical protein
MENVKAWALVLAIGLAYLLLSSTLQAVTGWSARAIGAGGLILLGLGYLIHKAIKRPS